MEARRNLARDADNVGRVGMQAERIAAFRRLFGAGHERAIELRQRDVGDTQYLLGSVTDRASRHAHCRVLLGEAWQSAEVTSTLGVAILQEIVGAAGGLRRVAGTEAQAIGVEGGLIEPDELE